LKNQTQSLGSMESDWEYVLGFGFGLMGVLKRSQKLGIFLPNKKYLFT